MIVHVQPREVADRLKERFDWFAAAFVLAVQQGFIERVNASHFDPPTAPGWDAWRYTLRSLRQQGDARGWVMADPGNLSMIINEEREVAIVVFSGDDATGLAHLKPKSKSPRGPMVREAVARNTGQLPLFPEMIEEARPTAEEVLGYETWVLLIHIMDEGLRAELSLPIAFDDKEFVSDWKERIIIDVPMPGSESEQTPDANDGPDIMPDVNFKL